MLAVAVSGVLIYGECLRRKSLAYAARADWFEALATFPKCGTMLLGSSPVETATNVQRMEARERYWKVMAEKYRYAARRPWLPVLRDPPEPE
jgi:hypothetical protein